MTLFCPVTGLKVFTTPDWINQKVSETFETNFWIIGESIIYSKPKGYSDFEGVKKSLALNDEVAAFVSSGRDSYVQIEDYSFLKGSSTKARRYFINKINEDNRRESIIFCNTTLPFNIAIKIGKQFNTTNKYIHAARNYKDAILHAKILTNIEDQQLDSTISDILKAFNYEGTSLSPVELLSKKQWQIETPEFSNHTVVINNSILHSTTIGFLRSQHIPLIDHMRHQCQSSLPDNSTLEYIIINCGELNGSSRLARFKFMQALKDWHRRFPFRIYIPYNANLFARTAFQIAKPLMPFRVKVAQNLGHALQLVQNDQLKALPIEIKGKVKKNITLNEKDIENLLSLIGSLNWEVKGFEKSLNVPQNHPFFYIYQSVGLIKEELDELFTERTRFEGQLQQSHKMESIGRLAGGIAHDFNNLLYVVMGNISLAQDDLKPEIETSESLKEAEKACIKAKELAARLITFSKGGDPVKKMMFINDLLKDIVISVLSGSNIKPEISISDDLRQINIDEGQIKQVVRNIIVNAREAMDDNGHLKVSCENIDITEEGYPTLNQGEYIKISFKDQGCGISKENFEKIFDPYFSTKDMGVDKGQGLGLTVSYSIIQKHRGLIAVESETGTGSTFSVYLPTFLVKEPDLQKSEEKPKAQESIKKPATSTGKILLMDDERAIRKFLGRVINKLGYDVETCIEGKEVVEIYTKAMESKQPFDVVILDLTNKIGMGGQATMKKLLEINPDAKGIVITGYSDDPVVANFRAYGFSGFITKPATMEELNKVIKEILS
jgi:signal transduction histidine kinase/ActR/RegA family two-component response regulator